MQLARRSLRGAMPRALLPGRANCSRGVPHCAPGCPAPGCAGTPLQPSRRRWMGPLMYFQAAKWLASVGYITFCIKAVYSLPSTCWQGGRRGVIEAMLWSTISIFVVLG